MDESARHHDALLEELRDLPPSAKLVVKTLQYEGELTTKDIIVETRLPPRTVRDTVTRLEKHGIITSQTSFMNARRRLYTLHPTYIESVVR